MITEQVAGLPAPPWSLFFRLWGRIARLAQRPPRRLRVLETVPLGERRMVAVVEFERSRFLLGGTASSLVLLADLSPREDGDK